MGSRARTRTREYRGPAGQPAGRHDPGPSDPRRDLRRPERRLSARLRRSASARILTTWKATIDRCELPDSVFSERDESLPGPPIRGVGRRDNRWVIPGELAHGRANSPRSRRDGGSLWVRAHARGTADPRPRRPSHPPYNPPIGINPSIPFSRRSRYVDYNRELSLLPTVRTDRRRSCRKCDWTSAPE
jgi:hypothetical protein